MKDSIPIVVSSEMSIKLAARKIKSQFPDVPEGKLMHAIVAGAMSDLLDKNTCSQALSYFKGPMIHAERAGVNPVWIRETMQKCGIPLY